MRMMRITARAAVLAALLACLLCGCATYQNPLTGEEEQTLYSVQDEIALGRQVANDINKQIKLDEDPKRMELARRVGKKVAAASERPDLPYEFRVIDSKDFNAFALPGGFIYVNRGLLEGVSESELAAVLAHEVAHVVARHGVKAMEAEFGYSLATLVAVAIWGEEDVTEVTDFSDSAFALVLMGYGRRDELQSDRLGIRYATRAGYDSGAMVSMLTKLKKAQGGNESLAFLSTHPPIDLRIEKAREAAAGRTAPEKARTAPGRTNSW